MSQVGRGARVAVACLFASALAFGAVMPTAGAELASFSGTATSYALKVTIDLNGLPATVKAAVDGAWATARNALPADQKASVPEQFPYKIEQTFLKSTSDASATVTKAVSVLSDGTVPARADWIVTADGPGQDKSSSVNAAKFIDPSVLSVSPINANAAVLKASVAAGPKVDGNNTLANVSTTLQSVGTLLAGTPAGTTFNTAFQGVLDSVNANITNGASTFNSTVNSAANAAGSAIAGTPLGATLAGQGVNLSDVAASLNLPTSLVIPNPLTAVSFATVTDLNSKANAVRNGDLTSSDSTSSIKAVNTLDDLLTTGLINLSSHSEVNGQPGSAKNTTSCTLADVRLGNQDGVAFDGKSVYVNGTAVPVPSDQVNGLKTQVDLLLGQVGVSVKLCDAAKASAAADGTSAEQSLSAFTITLEPKIPADTSALPAPVQTALTTLGLSASQAFGIKVIIDPTVTTRAQAQPAPALAPAQLPRTGAPAMASILTGLALMSGGFAMRRRMR